MIPARASIGRLAGCMVLWLGSAAGIVAPAGAQAPDDAASEAFAAGEAAFADADYAAALRAFERARDAGADGAAVHYNIGVSQYRLGEFAAAAETFRMIAARFPRMRGVADYNLGLALVELGRTSSARAAFARAQRSDDATVARLAAAMLGRLAPARERESRSRVALVDLSAGRDDNVALVDELSVPAAEFLESPFLEALGYVNAPVGDAGRFGFEATGYWIDYRDAAPYDQRALRVGFDYRALDGARRLTLGPYYERSELGGTGFERRFGLDLDVALRVGERGALALRLGVADVDALDARYGYTAGEQRRARVRFRGPLASGVFTARYGWEDNDRAAASVSAVRHRIRLGWRRRLGARWETGFELGYRESRYDELATPRIEHRRRLAFDAARDLGSGWQLTGTLSLTDNDASRRVYGYERRVLSLGMRKVF